MTYSLFKKLTVALLFMTLSAVCSAQALLSPSGLEAVKGKSPNSAYITWSPNSQVVVQYKITKNNKVIAYVKADSTKDEDGKLFFVDQNLVPGKWYNYSITSLDERDRQSIGASTVSYQVPSTYLNPPSGFTLVRDVNNSNRALLQWNYSSQAYSYNIYRNNVRIKNVKNNYTDPNKRTNTYLDTLLTTPGLYTYSITTINNNGFESEKSAGKTIHISHSNTQQTSLQNIYTPNNQQTGFQPPTIDIIKLANSNNTNDIYVHWNRVDGATWYDLYRNGVKIKRLSGETHGYVDINVRPGNHYYQLKSVKSDYTESPISTKLYFLVEGAQTVHPPLLPNYVDTNSSRNQIPFEQPDNYELVFSDEFNSCKLDTHRWNTQMLWSNDLTINNEKQYYIPAADVNNIKNDQLDYNPFIFENCNYGRSEALSIQVKKTRNDKKWLTGGRPYMSGMLSTYKKMNFKFGYFEARIKIPDSTGTFPAFWLLHSRPRHGDLPTMRSEIDIFENLGHDPYTIYNTAHYFDNVSHGYEGDHQMVKLPQVKSDKKFSDDFHVYGLKWEHSSKNGVTLTWYIDGQVVNTSRENNFDFEEKYLVVNLAMGGNWMAYPQSIGGLGYNFPNAQDLNRPDPKLVIDWIRAYKQR